jgi:hypothetical protein
MLFFIIKWFILYLLLIIITHYLYLFFEKNLTSTKTKDFIGFSNNEYNKINKILETNNNNIINTDNNKTNTNNNIMDFKSDNLDFKSDKFDLNSFNSIFETNNFSQENNKNSTSMTGDLDEFLNKLNSK